MEFDVVEFIIQMQRLGFVMMGLAGVFIICWIVTVLLKNKRRK